jgi:hypothetical protein
MLADIPNPWRAFLSDIDALLGPHRGDGPPVELHCVGGFVVAMCYNLARSTADLDVFEVVPPAALGPMVAAAGKGTPLAKKHGVYIDAGSRVATLPEGYADRLTEIFPGTFVNLKLRVLDRYDLALSKLERNIDRDLEDVQLLSRSDGFDLGMLRERYVREVRPFVTGPVGRHDLTLELWVEMIEELGKGSE